MTSHRIYGVRAMNVAAQATEQVVRAASHAGARAGAATPAVITAIAAMQLRKAVLQANEQVKERTGPVSTPTGIKEPIRQAKRRGRNIDLFIFVSFKST